MAKKGLRLRKLNSPPSTFRHCNFIQIPIKSFFPSTPDVMHQYSWINISTFDWIYLTNIMLSSKAGLLFNLLQIRDFSFKFSFWVFRRRFPRKATLIDSRHLFTLLKKDLDFLKKMFRIKLWVLNGLRKIDDFVGKFEHFGNWLLQFIFESHSDSQSIFQILYIVSRVISDSSLTQSKRLVWLTCMHSWLKH